MTNPLKQLQEFGQSVWLDYIERGLIRSPRFDRLIEEDGIRGVTSNPTIFDKAISGSADYDDQIRQLVRTGGADANRIYEAVTAADIRAAADKLRPVYDASDGMYGFVCYEVPPAMAYDTAATVATANRYFAEIDRPNLMVKVPSTPDGIPAIEQLIAEGRNINITLMFSLKHYEAVAQAYINGLEMRASRGRPLDRVASVASVFVSRIDTLVDKRLEQIKAGANGDGAQLAGKAAVANTKLIYQRFKQLFGADRFKALAAKGARTQKPLWASTGTKNPAYSDIKYVQELIGPDTVNTMPEATMDAFRDHGRPAVTIEEGLDAARDAVGRLAALGIDLDEVGDELQKEGVALFAKSFEDLQAVIESKRKSLGADMPARHA